MRVLVAALACWGFACPVRAGLYYSGEEFAELPSRPSGFLTDHRSLRAAAWERPADLPSPFRDDYLAAIDRLTQLAKRRPLTADEWADLGALYLRTGQTEQALNVLVPAARRFPQHFRLAANLGTAFQYAGDLERASAQLEEALRLAPATLQPFERAHLKLVNLRLKEGKAARDFTTVDDLFGVRYVGPSGGPEAGLLAAEEWKKLPPEAMAVVQQLALWFPADPRLVWQFAELCNAFGDVRAAAAALDGCVTEFAVAAVELRKRRLIYRAAVEAREKNPQHEPFRSTLKPKSSRPLRRAFDEALLPAVREEGVNVLPWPVLTATGFDASGRPTFAKYLEQLDGKRVTLTGFMQPSRDELAVTAFLLLEYPVGCWFCEVPDPTGMLNVELKAGKTATFQKGLIKVTGRLELNRTDPESYLFSLKDAHLGLVD